ncbi:MAG: hypothetical protein ABSC30_06035 [Acidimicrobiales bacterium]
MSWPVYARVQTFHLDGQNMPKLVDALDVAADEVRLLPGFGGLLCLEDQYSGRWHLVTVITLWNAEGLAASASQAEEARRLIAQASDLGVTSHERNVVRFALGEKIEEIGR